MERRRLETLLAVARLGGLSHAADELEIAPSTVALHLSELERELGLKLTERVGRGIRLTTPARQLLGHAESVVLAIDRLRMAAEAVSAGRAGTVRLGAIEPAASLRLPSLLARFCNDRPAVAIRVEVAGTVSLCDAVAHGRLDLALCSSPTHGDRLTFEPVFFERLDLLVPSKHPLATADQVRPTDLAGQRLLVTEESCAYRKTVLQALRARGVVLDSLIQIGSTTALAGAVAAGLGIAFVPLGGMQPPLGTIRRQLTDLPTALAVGLVTPRQAPLSVPASGLAECLRKLGTAL